MNTKNKTDKSVKFWKFYASPKTAFFVFFIASVILGFSALGIETGEKKDSRYTVFSVEFEYFGMDAKKIEEIITVPLEARLNSIPGILELRSVAEHSKTVTSIYFSKKEKSDRLYLLVSNAADSVYEKLPSDVQKPRIYSSEAGAKGVFCAAFSVKDGQQEKLSALTLYIENSLRKKIEAVEGVSQVIVSGGLEEEICAVFDSQKAGAARVNPNAIVQAVQDGNSGSFSSYLQTGNEKQPVEFNTRLSSLKQLKMLPVNSGDGVFALEKIAEIKKISGEEKSLSFLGNKKCVFLTVKSSSEGNGIRISDACRKIIENQSVAGEPEGLDFKILYDMGQKQKKMLKGVFFSLLQGLACILIIIPLFFKSKKMVFLTFMLLPVSCIWTLGIFRILGMSINQNTLAGISIALGLVADPALVVAEMAEKQKSGLNSKEQFFMELKTQNGSLISAGLTTLLACLPLFFMDAILPGIGGIALAITVMTVVSAVLVLIFLPCFIFDEGKKKISPEKKGFFERRIFLRNFYRMAVFAGRNRKVFLTVFAVMVLSPVCFMFFAGKNLSFENQGNVVFCSVDFESGRTKESVRDSLLPFVNRLNQESFVEFVKWEVSKGSGEFEIGFSEDKNRGEVCSFVAGLQPLICDGFLYVEGAKKSYRRKHLKMQLAFTGDDSEKCRENAEKAAEILQQTGKYGTVVLNFKEAETQYVFYPDREKLFKNGLTVQGLSSDLRWFMFGPVADKWYDGNKEYDVRVRGNFKENPDYLSFSRLLVPVEGGVVPLESLGKIALEKAVPKIYRKDGRRCAFITLEADGVSAQRAVEDVKAVLKNFDFDKGYSFSLDRELQRLGEDYRTLIYGIGFCIVQIFLVLVCLTEDFRKSLWIIFTVPASCFLPLFVKAVVRSPFVPGDLVGMIILSGISVNNAIYVFESRNEKNLFKIRSRIKSIMLSSLTTMAGAVPLCLTGSGNFAGAVAFFTVFGILNSLVVTCMVLPCARTCAPAAHALPLLRRGKDWKGGGAVAQQWSAKARNPGKPGFWRVWFLSLPKEANLPKSRPNKKNMEENYEK
ncbi:efflux RND transporter permease subunit [uncultured Treponema sp.]|uniref:efflux RND transporter permease subunit n=1 Tax=uncultured Treponema sp. TaxID=162155 RepID=UPI0015BE1BC9|nr:efflux RND transporter permease subunit [uncultured Treponema sp.]